MTFTTVLNFILLTAVAANLVMCVLHWQQYGRWVRINRMLLTICRDAYVNPALRPTVVRMMVKQGRVTVLPVPPRDD
jgi:hypothetical protein